MSHIVSIKTEVRDRAAVEAACSRLRWPVPVVGSHRLFTRAVEGLGVQAPRWQYPIVCNLTTGELSYDNYEGRWGDAVELDRFKQSYAVENCSRSQCPLRNGFSFEKLIGPDLSIGV